MWSIYSHEWYFFSIAWRSRLRQKRSINTDIAKSKKHRMYYGNKFYYFRLRLTAFSPRHRQRVKPIILYTICDSFELYLKRQSQNQFRRTKGGLFYKEEGWIACLRQKQMQIISRPDSIRTNNPRRMHVGEDGWKRNRRRKNYQPRR